MLVRDVMVRTVRTVKPDEPLRSVAAVICTNKISGMPVVDDEDRLIGIISEKDILNALLPSFHDFLEDPIRARDFQSMEEAYTGLLTKTVADLMTRRAVYVTPDDPVMKAASQMSLQKFRRVPVVEGGKLVGIISLGDIHKAIFKREFGLK
ncbi:MAG: CBS domain-containing protein [Magnetococcales bacterium]|nr:CBS domain-containing protein [Magnetococcales bacterium]MBF0156840.1 CBS domain-containing protein [Magnetococcales bacterium]